MLQFHPVVQVEGNMLRLAALRVQMPDLPHVAGPAAKNHNS